jgi:hypothetical protein
MILYPMLLTGRAFVIGGLGGVTLGFVASFFFIGDTWFPPGTPYFFKLQTRFGIGLCAFAWILGLLGIANSYATPLVIRDAPIVYKRTSTQADPNRRSHYVGARVWPSSRDVYEITVPRDLYDRLDVPETAPYVPQHNLDAPPTGELLRLAVGRGRFGIDWLSNVGTVVSGAR